ncbi:MAG TPA: glycoside hydrolase family 3 C-terminal domain-containing protein [Acidobacteriaceae bacterium]|nr:glycoside hydrolase family 3 C-terminal domain-containing protein [Acidobacteriaceae bacterium]
MNTFFLRSLCCATVLVSLSFAVVMHAQTQTPRQRAAALVAKMTLPEKVSQMQNHAVAIPRLDIPEYDWWSEGLHGIARSGYATVFPQAIGLAATWDTPLMHETATVISTEARAKNSDALRHDNHSIYFGLDIWSPNINIFRDPRWGRGQETYGEDPYLTSRMGVAFVTGLQGDDPRFFKTIATPKHFAVHSGPESTRHTVNVIASPHDLEDTYLPAFRATITEAYAGSTMCAYNSLDGEPACANTMLLHDILRGDWKFNGYVTSDCAAITDIAVGHKFAPDLEHAAVDAVRAGTDTSCGKEYAKLTDAVKDGLIKESEIDQSVTRLFTARMRLGLFDPPASVPYAQIPFSQNDSEQHRMLARRVSEESMVLLKNDGVLPLAKSVHTIAVIGPNAAALSAIEGNYNAVPSKPVVPLLGMERLFGESAILYAQGAPYVAEAAVPVPRTVLHPAMDTKREGLSAEYFGNADFSGAPVVTRVDPQINFDWNAAAPVEGADMKGFSVRWSGALAVPVAGDYTFSFTLAHCYPCNDAESVRVWVDDKEVSNEAQAAKDSRASGTKPFTVHFADNKPHAFRVEYAHKARLFGAGITLDWRPNIEAERAEAVEIARRADVVVAFVGLTPELEGEEMPIHIEGFDGGDRTSIDLPAAQEEMLKAVGATGKPVIVVLLNGSDVSSPWAMEHAAAILDAWYPGEEGGTAIARTLAGENNPAGRLPVTFYASTEQIPAFDNYSMKGRTYRYLDGKPEFGFGFGLSYSKFVYSHMKLSTASVAAGDSLTVEADVKNASARDGDEVAELYLVPPKDGVAPKLALEDFSRMHLKAGETRHVKFVLDARQMSVVDAAGVRAVRAGTYGLALGGGQPSEATDLSAQFTISGEKPLPR